MNQVTVFDPETDELLVRVFLDEGKTKAIIKVGYAVDVDGEILMNEGEDSMNETTTRVNVFISQPMNGLSDDEIRAVREQALKELEAEYGSVYDVDPFQPDRMGDPVYLLGGSIRRMSYADAVYFCDGWQDARGCRIEHDAAEAYELNIIRE